MPFEKKKCGGRQIMQDGLLFGHGLLWKAGR